MTVDLENISSGAPTPNCYGIELAMDLGPDPLGRDTYARHDGSLEDLYRGAGATAIAGEATTPALLEGAKKWKIRGGSDPACDGYGRKKRSRADF